MHGIILFNMKVLCKMDGVFIKAEKATLVMLDGLQNEENLFEQTTDI